MGSGGNARATAKPIMLIATIMLNPRNWPTIIFRGVMVLLLDASAKKVIKTNMSSMFVEANVAQASPTTAPKCILKMVKLGAYVNKWLGSMCKQGPMPGEMIRWATAGVG